MNLETVPRASYTDEAREEILALMDEMDNYAMLELVAMGIAATMNKMTRPNYSLTIMEEAIRLTLNKRSQERRL